MKKMMMILMMVVTMMTGLFADVTLLPKDAFNNCIVSVFENTPFIQPQITYIADTWEDVYKKTGVDKYSWTEKDSVYCDNTEYQYLLIIKCKVRGDLGWICLEYPGDGSLVLYTTGVEY